MNSQWLEMISRSALGYKETCEATYDIACSLIQREIPGEFVECGVYAGAQAAIMAKAILDTGCIHRKVHLFDSFTGIPLLARKIMSFERRTSREGESAISLQAVKRNMAKWGIPDALLVYHEGLFEHTVPTAPIERIALLRLDGDLYTSTEVCMRVLYPKVVRGGWAIVDDFNLSGCRKAVMEAVVPAPIYWRVPTK